MKWCNVSFLRKQESRPFCTCLLLCSCVLLLGKRELWDTFFLDSRFRGNDTPGPGSLEPASPARGEVGCFIRLNSYSNCK